MSEPVASLDPSRLDMLQAMGIDVWQRRAMAPTDSSVALADTRPGVTVSAHPAGHSIVADGAARATPADAWQTLQDQVVACTACELHRGRTQTVFGVGDPSAHCLVIGEAPGAEEDRRGEPFVGRAGQLLNAMLGAIGLQREQVFIANILKCRPPQNRDPEAQEVAACSQFLARQVAMIKPRLILALGRVAAQNLLNTDTPIGRMRGQLYHYGDEQIPVVVTYHPAYLLRSPGEKRKSWTDLQTAAELLREAQA